MSKPNDPLFDFRVIVSRDETYKTWIARCLETGSVATADSAKVASEMIVELLTDELQYALDRDNLANLFSSPASASYWGLYHSTPGGLRRVEWLATWSKLGQEYGAVAMILTQPENEAGA